MGYLSQDGYSPNLWLLTAILLCRLIPGMDPARGEGRSDGCHAAQVNGSNHAG
jgi:hypothetical protein